MYRKIIASFMTALMAAMTLVGPALGASALKDYPTFLGKVGDFHVVVGAKAASEDVAGAIDIAANLAQLSYTERSTSGTTSSIAGSERKIQIPSHSGVGALAAGSPGANQFPTQLKTFHFSGLKEGTVEYKGTKYNFHEEVELSTTNASAGVSHTLSTPVNGTLKMRIEQGGVKYLHRFDGTIPAADWSFTAANATTYSTPLGISLLGTSFSIVAVPSTSSWTGLVGKVDWVEQGSATGLTVNDLTALVDTVYSGTQAAVRIVDAAGNTVQNLGVVGTSTKTFTQSGKTYNIKVLQTATVTVAGAGANRAQLLFGEGDVEKEFTGSTTSTISAWGSDWKIGGQFAAAGRIQSGDNITVTYSPDSLDDAKRYYNPSTKFSGPSGYFELNYAGYSPSTFAKITIESSGTQTLYNSTASNAQTDSVAGIKLTTSVAGSLVYGGTGYDEMYVLFNETSNSTANFNGTEYTVAYKDKATSRVLNLTVPTNLDSNVTAGGTLGPIIALSYGGPGASLTDSLTFYFSDTRLIQNITLNSTSTATQVMLNFTNRTAASTTSNPEFQLGSNSATADTNDVQARIEGSVSDVATQVGDLITDGGVVVYSVKSNAESNKAIVGMPPETVYGLVQFGRTGGAATTGGTFKEVVAVTTAIAKLDTEVGTTEKTKNLVSVGGPCVNSVTAAAMGKTFPTCGTASGVPENKALIQAFDGTYTTGKVVVVVAGWEAKDTRLASSVLQNYAQKLTGITASKVEVSGTAVASATVTPA